MAILAWPPLCYFTFYESGLNVSCLYGSSKPCCCVFFFQNFNVSINSVAATSKCCESAMLCKIKKKKHGFQMTSNIVTFVSSFVNIYRFIISFNAEDTLTQWAQYLSRYIDWQQAGRSEIESRWGRDFPPFQTGSGAHPNSCKMGTGSFPGVKSGWGVLLTTHPPSIAAVMEE